MEWQWGKGKRETSSTVAWLFFYEGIQHGQRCNVTATALFYTADWKEKHLNLFQGDSLFQRSQEMLTTENLVVAP